VIRIEGQYRTLYCDERGCRATVSVLAVSAEKARAFAAEQGWLAGAVHPDAVRSCDFCPTHKAQIERAELEANDA